MSIQNPINQISRSQNPLGMIMSTLPNQNLKEIFSNLANKGSDEERAQLIANFCNENHITKEQLINAIKHNR